MKKIILASASPRRREILSSYREDFDVLPTDADETVKEGTPPDETVRILAARKARACADAHPCRGAVYIGSDTIVYVDGVILGKPEDGEHARRMLCAMRGKSHQVWSGVCVITDGGEYVGAEVTAVKMREYTDAEIERYIASGECEGKAGAYAIQGKGGVLVEGIAGSFQNVVGLPILTLDALLKEAGEDGLL